MEDYKIRRIQFVYGTIGMIVILVLSCFLCALNYVWVALVVAVGGTLWLCSLVKDVGRKERGELK